MGKIITCRSRWNHGMFGKRMRRKDVEKCKGKRGEKKHGEDRRDAVYVGQ